MNKLGKIIILAISAMLILAATFWVKQEYYSASNNDSEDNSLNQLSGDITNNSTSNDNVTNNSTSSSSVQNNTTDFSSDNSTTNISQESIIGSFNLSYEYFYPAGWYPQYNQYNSTPVFYFTTNWTDWNSSYYKNINYPGEIYQPNFTAYAYAHYYWGEKNTGGYNVQFQNVSYNNGTILLTIILDGPEPGQFVTMAFTYPSDFIRISLDQLDGMTNYSVSIKFIYE